MSAVSSSGFSIPSEPFDLATPVAESMAAARDGGTRIGPFTIGFDADTANVWRNYAVPDGGAAPTAADVEALIEAFERRDRTPRLEYVPATAPAVESALLAAGFTIEGRSPVYGCRRGEATALAAPDGVVFALVRDESDLLDAVHVQNAAYGEPAPAGPRDVARLAALNERGGIVALARDATTGQPVASGLCEIHRNRVSELAAVGVVAGYRRRGIASALMAFLARSILQRGADLVWLEQEPALPPRLYELAGFTRGAEKLWISRPRDVIIAGPVRLHPVSIAQARAIMDGGAAGLGPALRAGYGWPHEDTAAGMWMVLNKGAEGWLATLDGSVIGDAGALVEEGDAMFALTLTQAYRESNLRTAISTALADTLRARPGTRSVTDGSSTSVDRRPPTIAAGERDTLLAFVGYLRECLIGKLNGVSEADARRALVDSGTSLLGLVKHVASTEHSWIVYSFAGGAADDIPTESLTDDDSIASVVAAARAVGVRTEEIVRGCDDIETPAATRFGADARTLRWILVHLVEEIGRHAGHADIIREQIDGATGR